MIRLFFTIVFGIFFFTDFVCIVSAQVEEVKIGVLAKRGSQRCLQEWAPTARYLSDKIPDQCFDIVPVSYEEIFSLVENDKVGFILSNSSIYIELESRYGANRIVTLKNRRLSGIYTTYCGAIFCRSDRRDISNLSDLKNKKFMAVHRNSLGGWLMAWRELKAVGIDPYHDFKELRFDTYQDTVVYAVLQGKVDAGTVRTSVLEQMVAEKKINLQDFQLLNRQGHEKAALPLPCSTRQYPEWPIAKLKHTADELAEKVAIALIQMPSDSPAAIAAGCAGWTIPLNYQPVHECLKELKVGPYKDSGKITFSDVFKKYRSWILSALSLFCVLVGFTALVLKLNRNIKASHAALEKEVNERKRTENALHKANQELQDLAVLDPLTQIANRRSCDIHLDREWRRMRREQAPLSLIFCDIDYFKLYNDTYGHQAGDECLRRVALTIKQKVKRPADLAARYGGEEFILILPNIDATGAVSLAESIRKEVEQLKIENAQSKVSPYLTLSLGVAGMIPKEEFLPELLIKTADQALYQAKNQGRNQVVLKTIDSLPQ